MRWMQLGAFYPVLEEPQRHRQQRRTSRSFAHDSSQPLILEEPAVNSLALSVHATKGKTARAIDTKLGARDICSPWQPLAVLRK